MITGDAVEAWLKSIPPDTVVYPDGEEVSCNCVVTQYAKTVLPDAYSSAPNYGGLLGEAPAHIYKIDDAGLEQVLEPCDNRARRMMTEFDYERSYQEEMTAARALEIIEKEGI